MVAVSRGPVIDGVTHMRIVVDVSLTSGLYIAQPSNPDGHNIRFALAGKLPLTCESSEYYHAGVFVDPATAGQQATQAMQNMTQDASSPPNSTSSSSLSSSSGAILSISAHVPLPAAVFNCGGASTLTAFLRVLFLRVDIDLSDQVRGGVVVW